MLWSDVWSTTTTFGPTLVQENEASSRAHPKAYKGKAYQVLQANKVKFVHFCIIQFALTVALEGEKDMSSVLCEIELRMEGKVAPGWILQQEEVSAGAGGGGRLPQCNWFSLLQSHPFTTTSPAESMLWRIGKTKTKTEKKTKTITHAPEESELWRFVKLQALPKLGSKN